MCLLDFHLLCFSFSILKNSFLHNEIILIGTTILKVLSQEFKASLIKEMYVLFFTHAGTGADAASSFTLFFSTNLSAHKK